DTHPNRDAPVTCFPGDGLDVCFLANVARIQTQPMYTCLHGGERQLVLEMDVGHDRHRRPRDDLGQSLGGLDVVAGDAHDVRAGTPEGVDLSEGSVDIGRLGGRHRLDGHRGATTHGYVTHLDLAGQLARNHRVNRRELEPMAVRPEVIRQNRIGLKMSRMIPASPRNVNSTTTATATGTSLRTSGSRPVTFCHSATAKWPPSSGRSGITLKVARITFTEARKPT